MNPEAEISNNYDGYASPWEYIAGSPYLRLENGTGTITSKVGHGTATTTTWLFGLDGTDAKSTSAPYGNTFELRVAVADSDNYVFAKLRYVSYAAPVLGTPERWTWGVQLWERIGGTETAISDEETFKTTAIDTPAIEGPSIRWNLCITEGVGNSNNEDSGDYYYEFQDCGTHDELMLNIGDGLTLRGTISDLSALGNKHGVQIVSPAVGVRGGVFSIVAKVHEYGCSQCNCTFCEPGTSPEQLRARFVDIDTPDPEPEYWAYMEPWLTAWHTYDRGYYWYYALVGGELKAWSSCNYGYREDSFANKTIGEGGPYYLRIELNPSSTPPQIRFLGGYLKSSAMVYDQGVLQVQTLPVNCCDFFDGLEVPMTSLAAIGRDWFLVSKTITGSSATSLTVAEDWSYLVAGRTLKIVSGGSTEYYTVDSVSGTGPTTITVDEAVPADRTGWTVTKWATLQIEVVQ
jgi:hypothetical protein